MVYWDVETMLRHVTITVTLKNKEGKQKNMLMARREVKEYNVFTAVRYLKGGWRLRYSL